MGEIDGRWFVISLSMGLVSSSSAASSELHVHPRFTSPVPVR